MVIKIGDNPEFSANVNKFIAKSGDGMRGVVLALSEDCKKAVILAQNNSVKKDVEWGKLYLIEETNPEQWPVVIRQVSCVPNVRGWRGVL